jgi:hypothetical protein
VGDRVALQIGAAGSTQALIVALDGLGQASVLWSGSVSPGLSTLSPPFVITPGNVELHAFFSDVPFPSPDVCAAVERARGRAVPVLTNERGRAKMTLQVQP